jgi:putative membrane protein
MAGDHDWLGNDAKTRVERAVVALEAQTSAELVVTVRQSSGHYRAADLSFASLVAGLGLFVYVYHPAEFADDAVPPALLVLYACAAFFCAQVPALRRRFVRGSTLRDNVRRAALTAFHEQRIDGTSARTGILIYVSLFERMVEVVPDVGVDAKKLGVEFGKAVVEVTAAIRGDGIRQLEQGLLQMAAPLARELPRADDDVNELPDGMVS